MAMFWEKRNRPSKGKKVEAAYPTDDRYQTENDLQALVRAKKINKDLARKKKVQSLAKEKMATRKRRGRSHPEGYGEKEDHNFKPLNGKGPRQMDIQGGG